MNRRGFLGLLASAPAAVALAHTATPVALKTTPVPTLAQPMRAPVSRGALVFTEREILKDSLIIEQTIDRGTNCEFTIIGCHPLPAIGEHVTVDLSRYGVMFAGAIRQTDISYGYGQHPRVTLKAQSFEPQVESWSDTYNRWQR